MSVKPFSNLSLFLGAMFVIAFLAMGTAAFAQDAPAPLPPEMQQQEELAAEAIRRGSSSSRSRAAFGSFAAPRSCRLRFSTSTR